MASPGRKPHEPTAATRKLVEKNSGTGLPHEQIAILIGIDDKTLRKHYARELALGKAKAHAKIGGKCFSRAMKGSDTMLIWWTKTQMRWREERSLEISSPEGKPLGIEVSGEPELLGAYMERIARSAAERRANPRTRENLVPDGSGAEEPEGGKGARES